jgi:hypothetical protein
MILSEKSAWHCFSTPGEDARATCVFEMVSASSYQRVVSAGVKRMTFENPDKGQPATFEDSILLKGMASISRASRVKTTGRQAKR